MTSTLVKLYDSQDRELYFRHYPKKGDKNHGKADSDLYRKRTKEAQCSLLEQIKGISCFRYLHQAISFWRKRA